MLEQIQIERLLPHQGAMFLIDRVLSFDRDAIECSASSHRRPDNPLRHHDRLAAHVGAEYAAQAAGIHGGLLIQQRQPGAPPQMGYLAVISNLHWSIERLDHLQGDLLIHAYCTAITAIGSAYRIRIDHQSTTIISGDLIIALEHGST
jgi:predicted hotdog family 3-hydroxylacyl-ACP dehydratase